MDRSNGYWDNVCEASVYPHLKATEDDHLVFIKAATENVSKYVWCKGWIYGGCSRLSEDQTVSLAILYFFCLPSLQLLSAALKCFDGLSLADSKVAVVQNLVFEMQNQKYLPFSLISLCKSVSELSRKCSIIISANCSVFSHVVYYI